MSSIFVEPSRRLFPRWRSATSALALGELLPLGTEAPRGLDPVLVDEKVATWRESPTIGFASDAIGAGVLVGRLGPVREAAEWVLERRQEVPLPLLRLAGQALGRDLMLVSDDVKVSGTHRVGGSRSIDAVRVLRQRLRRYPRNALAWIDLGRCYATLGLLDQARRAIEAGVTLSPDGRFALRSAARFFIHAKEPERARRILRLSPATLSDPWLLAAEIAVSTDLGGRRHSRFWKQGRGLLTSADLPPSHLSELAGALGTIELLEGDGRAARKYFRQALVSPTENSVAQAEWANKSLGNIGVEPRHLHLPRSYEARAFRHYHDGNWEATLAEVRPWLDDEPFSSGPAIFGSFVATSLVNDPKAGEEIALKGLTANPTNGTLLNNLTVALAFQDKVDEARAVFARIAKREEAGVEDVGVWQATGGLLEFRGGHPEAGRQLYLQSLEHYKKAGLDQHYDRASLYLVAEELRQPRPDTEDLVRNLIQNLRAKGDPIVRTILQRVAMLLAQG